MQLGGVQIVISSGFFAINKCNKLREDSKTSSILQIMVFKIVADSLLSILKYIVVKYH